MYSEQTGAAKEPAKLVEKVGDKNVIFAAQTSVTVVRDSMQCK